MKNLFKECIYYRIFLNNNSNFSNSNRYFNIFSKKMNQLGVDLISVNNPRPINTHILPSLSLSVSVSLSPKNSFHPFEIHIQHKT